MTIYYQDDAVTLHHGDALEVLRSLPDASVECCVTSPPYFGLRDYGEPGQYGLEDSPAAYVETMRDVFAEVRRVLTSDGTLWLNLGDSYSGGARSTYDVDNGKTGGRGHSVTRPQTALPSKNLLGIPWRVAFALQDDGWILRSEIIWAKPSGMPESVKPWDAYEGREDAGFAYWLSGLIDGEGHFAIKAHSRGTHAPYFQLKMRADERGTLDRIRRLLGVGVVSIESKEPNPMAKYVIQDKAGCQRLVDLLDKYPLRAKKQLDYWTWREAVCEWTSRPRGNRWHGAVDNAHMAELRSRLMENRAYTDVPWSGHEFQDWCRLWATECLRVLKPGAHLLAFGGTRTWHRLACAVEDAGFEIRDSIAWLYGSGMPKSLDVSKAIDKLDAAAVRLERAREFQSWLRQYMTPKAVNEATGTDMGHHLTTHPTQPAVATAPIFDMLRPHLPEVPEAIELLVAERTVESENYARRGSTGVHEKVAGVSEWRAKYEGGKVAPVAEKKDVAHTPEAEAWQGWGTALKPAFEPIVVARKPLPYRRTVAANVLDHGTGALNIDATRIHTAGSEGVEYEVKRLKPGATLNREGGNWRPGDENAERYIGKTKDGRWPANVALDEAQAAALDEQSGERPSGGRSWAAGDSDTASWRALEGRDGPATRGDYSREGDSGGASRFFYVAREDNEPCHSTSSVSTAASHSPRQSGPVDSAPNGAATTASPDGERRTDSPSTSGTPSASRPSAGSGTTPTPNTADESSPDWQPGEPSQMVSRARYAASLSRTATTTTTTSPSSSDGSAEPTTSSTTQASALGVPLDELGSRFNYVAKADASERPRVNGTAHPTVKPLALMRWLVRLVTPPGGTVLEPFAGSGTTVEACIIEGFQCIAIEREADYLPLIRQRIDRRRDPVEALRGQAADLGLFDLLGGEGA